MSFFIIWQEIDYCHRSLPCEKNILTLTLSGFGVLNDATVVLQNRVDPGLFQKSLIQIFIEEHK